MTHSHIEILAVVLIAGCAPAKRTPVAPLPAPKATAAKAPAESKAGSLWPGADANDRHKPSGEGQLPSAFGRKSSKRSPAPSSSLVDLQLYVMSKCPFGTQVERSLTKLHGKVGDSVKLRIDYIVNERNGKFTALHGQSEVDGNIIELCVMSHYPKPADYLKFLDCQNDLMRSIPTRWKQCARRNGIDVGRIERCFSGGEGKQLLRASMTRAQAAQASGSPTIVIEGQKYTGGRSPRDLLTAVCNVIPSSAQPSDCKTIPPPKLVSLTILTDKRCKKCATADLIKNLRSRFFPKMKIKELDYSSAEAKRLYKSLKLKALPVYLFGPDVKQAAKYVNIKRWLSKLGPYLRLRVPANFDPTAEICDNKKDDTGNAKIDCADPTCTAKLICRPEKKRRVDLFVMSQCPFGNRALTAMQQVLSALPKIDFRIRYIVDKKPDGSFKALHGPAEVAENLRQVCAQKLYSRRNRHLLYVWCRSKNYRSSDWKSCARKAGISTRRLERCATGATGKKLLEQDHQLTKALHITGSPTWLINNRHKGSGIDADHIRKQLICPRNKTMNGC